MGLWQDIRYAGRSLAKAPGFTSVVVLILALGIGANVAMFSIMEMTMIRPLPYPEPERLVLGRATFGGNVNPFASAADYRDYRDLSTSFEYLTAFLGFTRSQTITGGDRPERVEGIIASIDLFPALGVGPTLGRQFNPDEALPNAAAVVIISHRYWMRRFGGDPDAIGSTLTLDGFPFEIVGVMPAGFGFYFNDVDVWRPMRPDSPMIAQRDNHNWIIVGRLGPGVTLEEAQSEVDVISAQLEAQYPESNTGKALLLTELQEALAEGYRGGLILLMGAVAFVLLIACGNAAGLLLARGSARRTEISVRAALGASGLRVVRQLLTESFVIAVAAGALGTTLALWFQELLVRLMRIDLPGVTQIGLSTSMLVFALIVSVLTGLLFGIVPAVRASRGDLVEDLKSGYRTTDAGGARFRSGLVVAQVAISIVLLVGAGLLIRSFASLVGVHPGFDTRNLLTAEIGLPFSQYRERERRVQFYRAVRERVRAIPGVEDVALINQLPILNPGNDEFVYDAENPPIDPSDRQTSNLRAVLPGYFEAMGIPLLEGRDIEETDVAGSPPVLVITRNMANVFFPGQSPIGRRLVIDWDPPVNCEVVGVVGDVRQGSLSSEPFRAMYGSYSQVPYLTMRLAVRTAVRPESVVPAFRQAVWSLGGDIPLDDVATMEARLGRTVSGWRIRAVALSIFAGVALLLAAVGLYSVLAYWVGRRHHEIGVRVALGAAARDVVGMVLRRGVALVAIGIAVGLIGALAATRLLEGMLFNVEPFDLATFLAVSLFFGCIAVIACLIPAWRALRVDPVIALQAE